MFDRSGRLAAVLGVLAICGAAGLAAYAQVAPPPSAIGAAPGSGLRVTASATNVQSFVWMVDENARTIMFCFTVSAPPTSPQYDFSCRTKTFTEAQIH